MENNQFRTLHEILPSEPHKGLSTSGPSRPSTCQADIATRRAGILLACFRKGDAENPEIYVGAVASVLSCYPEPIAYRVTDPRTGLAGRSQWLPTVAEVRSACEAEMAPTRSAEARLRRQAETETILSGPGAARVSAARWKDVSDRLGAKSGRPSIAPKSEEWLAEYGRQPLAVSDALRGNVSRRDAAE